jgi:hypothetical protein
VRGTAVPSAPVRVTGTAGAGVGVGLGAAVGAGVVTGATVANATDGLAGAPLELVMLQALSTMASAVSRTATRPSEPPLRAGGDDGNTGGNLRSGMGSEGVRRIANPSLRTWSKEGSIRKIARSAYLSLEGSSMHRVVGDRTCAREGRSP